MRFLIDAQLPPGLAKHLCDEGFDAIHLTTLLPGDATDRQVLNEANRLNAILITKDEDFSEFANRGLVLAGILWIRFGNVTNQTLWMRLRPLLPAIVDEFSKGGIIVEVA